MGGEGAQLAPGASTHLHGLPVEHRLDAQLLRVPQHRARHEAGPPGRPAVEALADGPLAAAPLELPVAVRDVVADGVAQDAVEGAGLGHVGAALADDGDELALVVEALAALGHAGDGDGVVGAGEGGGGLVEEHGVGGDGAVGLLGVAAVVEPQAAHRADVLRREGAQEAADVGHLVGDAVRAKDVPRDDARLPRLAYVRRAPGQDGVAVEGAAVLGEEADQALCGGGVMVGFVSELSTSRGAPKQWIVTTRWLPSVVWSARRGRTENAGIFAWMRWVSGRLRLACVGSWDRSLDLPVRCWGKCVPR